MSKKALIITYGCRQNSSDSEKIRGILANLGYEFCKTPSEANFIIFNTCAVREGAEARVYGNIGALKPLKQKNPNLLIAVCGCMASRPEVVDKIRRSFQHVDLVFGTNALHKLPNLIERARTTREFLQDGDETIHENIPPAIRDSKIVANIPIMYGCNNFCTYCIVPYVRGRERSRSAESIIKEAQSLANQGYKELQLLGQNVNSYAGKLDFPDLLSELAEIDKIERIRFISSHPKDFSSKLIETMAAHKKICNQLHLPFQSGSDKILKEMNRNYTRAHYTNLIKLARESMPNITISSDVIIGFPTETQTDFNDTLSLIKDLRLDLLFTFIYSKRAGTPAAKMDSTLPEEQIKANFNQLVKTQEEISEEKNRELLNSIQEVLVEGASKSNQESLTGRNDGGKIVNFTTNSKALPGDLVSVRITNTTPWALGGIYKNERDR